MVKSELTSSWLHLEILSMKVTTRISDKGQPWQHSEQSENKFDIYNSNANQTFLPFGFHTFKTKITVDKHLCL